MASLLTFLSSVDLVELCLSQKADMLWFANTDNIKSEICIQQTLKLLSKSGELKIIKQAFKTISLYAERVKNEVTCIK